MADKNDQQQEPKKKNSYRKESQRCMDELAKHTPGSPEYKAVLVAQHGLETNHDIKHSKRPTGDGIIKAATSVTSLFIMRIFETENPIRSKLLGLFTKLI